jgi:murein DD-endopeptidase MepM/ murein hydrolase activator NlpD
MAQQSNVPVNVPKKPSKLLALIALAVAFSLPFILVKTFPHKNKSVIDSIPLTLPAIQEQEEQDTSFDETNDNDSTNSNDAEDGKQADNQDNLETTKSDKNDTSSQQTSQGQKQTEANTNTTKHTNTTSKDSTTNAAGTANTTPKPPPPQQAQWKIIKTQRKDTMGSIFNRVGLNAKILSTIIHDISDAKALRQIQVNQELQFLIKDHKLEKMILPYGNTQFLTIYRSGEHYKSSLQQRKMDSRNVFLTASVRGSLSQTARRQNIPAKLIHQMTEIFTWDINFAKDVRSGDQFTMMYKAFYIDKKLISVGDIIAVSFKNNGHTYQAVRHTNRAGRTEYFTPQGASLKKAFSRYPLRFSHIGSPFSLSRYHPILHYARAHKGVDLAARIGTPIQATGDGRIEIIGSQSGYGNMIKIKHNKNFSTLYGHMLKFQKGLSKGSFVRRGQIIGYVGQTGLASGPHCHYEVHVNNQAKNPATVSLPRGEPVNRREFAKFKANTNVLLAQLKQFEHKGPAIQLAKK